METWMKQLDFKDPEKNLSAFYIQAISFLIIIGGFILGGVYFVDGQISYVAIILFEIMVYSAVIVLLRFKKLRIASNLFVIAALGLLTFGVLSVGSIHASSSVMFPVILVFASLFLDRKSYVAYGLLCVASIGFIIYAENQRLIPVIYRPDPPEFPLFITYALVVVVTGIIVRLITENLQNNLRKSRQYTQELSNQKAMLDRVGQAVMGCQMDGTIIYWNQAAMDLYGWDAKEIIGRKYYDAAPTQLSSEMTAEIQVALRKGEVWSGELMIQKRNQSWLPVIVSISPLWDETGSISGWIGTAADLSEHAKLEEIDRRRADEMSLLYSLGVSLASGKTLYDTLLALQAEISNLIQADAFYVAIYDAKTDRVNFPIFFHEGRPVEEASRKLHEKPGLTGAVIFSEKSLYLTDVFEPEVKEMYNPVDDSKLILHTFLGVPLISNGRTIGMLSVQSRQVDAYTPEQIQLMENIAIQAAIAIDKANLLDQLKQELADRTRAEDQLRDRELILEAITFAAEQFLKIADWRVNINAVLESLGKTLKVTHAYLFEDHLDSQGGMVTSMRYEWTAAGYPSDLDGEYFQDSKIEQKGFEEQVETLRRGEVRIGNSSTYNPLEKESMDSLGVKSILEVPIFVNGREWGAIGFDDFEQERVWSVAEVDALKIAVGVLSAAIQRQKTESAVRESEAIYRQAIEAAGAVPYYRDYRENRYTFMGSEIEKVIGYKPEEITFQLLLDIMKENIPLGEGMGLPIEDAVKRSRSGGLKIWKSDIRVIARNGETRWITDSAVELFDDSDLSYASIGIMQDITERKLTEVSLRKRESILEAMAFAAEQFLRTSNWRERMDIVLERLGTEFGASHAYLFEKHKDSNGEILSSMTYEWTAPDCISDLRDAEFQNMPLNPMDFDRMYEILDRGEPLVGSRSFFNEEEWQYMQSINVTALLEMRIVINGEHWGTLGFDDIFNEREWTSMEVDVIKVAANVLGAAIKRQLDEEALKDELAERKRAEQALIFSEEKFSKAFHTTPIMMTIEDANNIFVDVNKSFIDTIGFDREDIIGRRASDLNIFLAPGDIRKANSVLEDQDTFKDIELSFRKKHGEIFTVLMSIEKFYVNDIVYTLTSALNITERKHAEAEREKLIEELGVKNAELESFTYTVSHDLKSPLVTINGFLGYLEIDAASGNMERLKKDTLRIQDAVNKMQRLLNELLELSRIGRIINAPENVPFTDLVHDALEIVHGRLAERGITVDIQSNLPLIYGDKPRLVEALQNLLDNAAKYMGEQLIPHIVMGQRADDAEYDKPVFFVRDNGMGIAPEYHERIFGLFNKLDAKSEGTGVGLALVKRIIEIHGGRIWVESKIGKGSTFYFTLSKAAELKKFSD